MRIEMIGHAALLCETEDVRILMDPWIVGPANFKSWWHLPEVIRHDLSGLPPISYIYISHLHGDHFHEPTLAGLAQRPTVLVPRLHHDRMLSRLRKLGFHSHSGVASRQGSELDAGNSCLLYAHGQR